MVEQGQALVRACLRRNAPGPYQLQAAIAAVHSDGADATDTDWRQILALYDQLLALVSSPVVALNRAVALAEVAGPGAALLAVDALHLPGYLPYHLTRAELLVRTGRTDEARGMYDRALALARNAVEREHVVRRLDEAGNASPGHAAPG